jgi:hypothetical protein
MADVRTGQVRLLTKAAKLDAQSLAPDGRAWAGCHDASDRDAIALVAIFRIIRTRILPVRMTLVHALAHDTGTNRT